MTAPDYVAQVAELLREHSWQRVDTMGRATCRGDSGEHVYTGIDHEQHQAEVLAAAGLIPTSTAQTYLNGRVVERSVTDWKDAT